MSMAHSYEAKRRKSLAELKQEYDNLAASTLVGLNFIREEIVRREQSKETRAMIVLTVVIALLGVCLTKCQPRNKCGNL